MRIQYFLSISSCLIVLGTSLEKLHLGFTRKQFEGECLPREDVPVFNPLKARNNSSGIEDASHLATVCSHMEWNSTYHKNLLGRRTNLESIYTWMMTFEPLKKIECSPNTDRFLCSLALPACLSQDNSTEVDVLPPCRELCEAFQDGCGSILHNFGFAWPYPCNNFPQKDTVESKCVLPLN